MMAAAAQMMIVESRPRRSKRRHRPRRCHCHDYYDDYYWKNGTRHQSSITSHSSSHDHRHPAIFPHSSVERTSVDRRPICVDTPRRGIFHDTTIDRRPRAAIGTGWHCVLASRGRRRSNQRRCPSSSSSLLPWRT